MPEPIYLRDDTIDVTIKISIQTAANWGYNYQHKGNDFAYDITLPSKPFPHEYNLGNPNEGEIDVWNFQITNPLTTDTGYKVTIDWFQNGNPIHHWERSWPVSAGTMVTPSPGGAGEYFIKSLTQ